MLIVVSDYHRHEFYSSPTSRELTEDVLCRVFMFSRPKLDEIARDHFEMEVINDAMSHGDVCLCVVGKIYGCSRD